MKMKRTERRQKRGDQPKEMIMNGKRTKNMRRAINGLIIIMIILSLMLTGCSKTEPSQPATTSPAEKSQVTAQPVEVLYKVYTETIKDEDGTLLLEAKIVYPEVNNPAQNQALAAINEYYSIQFDDFVTNVISEGQEKALEDKKAALEGEYPFRPHAYGRDFTIEYNGNNLLSVLCQQYESTGGAHPNTFWLSQTFDVTTGKKLALTDFLVGSKNEALEKVYNTVLAQINEKEGTNDFVFNPSYAEDVKKYYNEEDFVLTDNSFKIYYQLYAIAAYATGFPQFEIPYDKEGVFVKAIPALLANPLEKEIYTQASQLIDRNKTIFFDIFFLKMLNLKIPENGVGNETVFPVDDERFMTYADLENFIRSTYVKSEADSLLGTGRYLDKDGKLYGDITKDGGMGYYVVWNNYSYEITDITNHSATLKIYTVDESPAGKENITINGKMIKQDSTWLLEKILQ